MTSIHPSPAPGREWELGLQSGQVKVALNAAEPWGHHHRLCDSRPGLALGVEAGAPQQNLPPGPVAPCPCWRCYGFWHLEVTLLLCKAPHRVPHPMVPGYVALFFLGTERQGHLAKVIHKGARAHTHTHTHTQNMALTHSDQEEGRTNVSRLRLPGPAFFPIHGSE